MADRATLEEVMKNLTKGLEQSFYMEAYDASIKRNVERGYNPEIIKAYYI